MKSVETVLETYGGPEDKWVDTFGVRRDIAAADAVQSAITYDGSCTDGSCTLSVRVGK